MYYLCSGCPQEVPNNTALENFHQMNKYHTQKLKSRLFTLHLASKVLKFYIAHHICTIP
jgi:hypothetical protein